MEEYPISPSFDASGKFKTDTGIAAAFPNTPILPNADSLSTITLETETESPGSARVVLPPAEDEVRVRSDEENNVVSNVANLFLPYHTVDHEDDDGLLIMRTKLSRGHKRIARPPSRVSLSSNWSYNSIDDDESIVGEISFEPSALSFVRASPPYITRFSGDPNAESDAISVWDLATTRKILYGDKRASYYRPSIDRVVVSPEPESVHNKPANAVRILLARVRKSLGLSVTSK